MAGLDDVKTWWRNLSRRDKWLVGGGAALVTVLLLGEAGGASQQINGDAGRMFTGNGQGYANPYDIKDNGDGYANEGGGGNSQDYGWAYQGQGSGGGQAYGYAGGGGGGASADSDPTGYWARQRSQDQQSQNFQNYMLDQNTIRSNDDGTVYSEVPNSVGDAAIASGSYSQVPTAELPTSSDTSSGE